jgi:uncharacterized Zn finger protein (UPF0148 family)
MSNRYYCPNCKMTLTVVRLDFWVERPQYFCPVCDGEERLTLIPDLEPLAAWEKRMERPCPDNMPVWYKAESKEMSVQWTLTEMGSVRKFLAYGFCRESEISIIIANGENKPWDEK